MDLGEWLWSKGTNALGAFGYGVEYTQTVIGDTAKEGLESPIFAPVNSSLDLVDYTTETWKKTAAFVAETTDEAKKKAGRLSTLLVWGAIGIGLFFVWRETR